MGIHQKQLQSLGTEIFKARLNISPEISFNVKKYDIRSQSTLKRIKKFLFTLAAKVSPHWHERYGAWFQTVSKMKSHWKDLIIGQKLEPLINVLVESVRYKSVKWGLYKLF